MDVSKAVDTEMSMTETELHQAAPVEELDAEALASLERSRQFARTNGYKYAQGKSRRHAASRRQPPAHYRQPYAD